jgi:outer membrane protein OmpA-like peptidoglycan-associated protein
VNRLGVVIGSAAILTLIGYGVYQGYANYRSTKDQVKALSQEVKQTSELAQKESAAASEAKEKAEEAAKNAASASDARQRAEALSKQSDEQRQQAETMRDQALTAAQKSAEQTKQAQDEVTKMRQEREQELNNMQEALSKLVETHRTADGMVMVLPDSSFRFAFDNAELTQKNRELLSRIAGILLVSKGYGLAVYGYTDDVGTAEYNQMLSERRAKAVDQYLVQAGVPAGIVSMKGYGKTSPIVKSNTQEARAKNRRVEIAVTYSRIKYAEDAAGTLTAK